MQMNVAVSLCSLLFAPLLKWEINHLSMAHPLSYHCTKNYWNWTTTVKVISGIWVVYFFCFRDVFRGGCPVDWLGRLPPLWFPTVFGSNRRSKNLKRTSFYLNVKFHYASAVYAVVVSVRPSVTRRYCFKKTTGQIKRVFGGGVLPPIHTVLYKEMWVSPEIRVLLCGTLSQTPDFKNISSRSVEASIALSTTLVVVDGRVC